MTLVVRVNIYNTLYFLMLNLIIYQTIITFLTILFELKFALPS